MSEKGKNEPFTKRPRTEDAYPAKGPGTPTAPISFTLKDQEVLDCPICFDHLSSPVYQCKNGHVACASCCIHLKKKCPSCFSPTGNIRCRAVEKIVESITVECQNKAYGCEEKLSYDKKNSHLRFCKYGPCYCPVPHCDFAGPGKSMYEHFSASHFVDHYFSFGSSLHLELDGSNEHVFLQERDEKVVFVLTQIKKSYGTFLNVVCVAPSEFADETYNVEMSVGDRFVGVLSLRAPVKSVAKWTAELPTTSCLIVPSNLVDFSLKLKLGIGLLYC